MNMTDKEFEDLAELDVLAAKAGGYVLQMTKKERNDFANHDLRAAFTCVKDLGRPLTDEEFVRFKYTL